LHPMYIVPIRARMAMASAVLAINVGLLNHEMVDNLVIHSMLHGFRIQWCAQQCK
jgi:hypothetical protein